MSTETNPDNRIPPSLGSLPSELKVLIVEMVDENDELDQEQEAEDDSDVEEIDDDGNVIEKPPHNCDDHAPGDHSHSHAPSHAPNEPHREGYGCCEYVPSTMNCLSLVNREFAGLCQPFLWNDLDFYERSNENIAWFILNPLPRHAEHISAIRFSVEERGDRDGEEDDLDEGWLAQPKKEPDPKKFSMCKAILGERASLSDPQRLRRELLAHIISQLPNLHTIAFDLVDHPEDELHPATEVTQALIASQPRLVELALSSSQASFPESYLANLLSHFPHVECLDLAIDEFSMVPTGRDALVNSIVAMKSLRTLALDHCPFVSHTFATAPFTAPLEILAITDCPDLTCTDFFKLLETVSRTLRVLEIDAVPVEVNEQEMAKFFGKPLPFPLPNLKALIVSTEYPVGFFQMFDDCPLRSIEVDFCPALTYNEFVDLVLLKHESTLKLEGGIVKVGSHNYFTDAQLESLGVWCLAKGIELHLDDGSDEDSGDDDEDGSDEDSDFERDWEDEVDEEDEGSAGDY